MSQKKPLVRQESIYSTGKTCDTKKDQLERIAIAAERLRDRYRNPQPNGG